MFDIISIVHDTQENVCNTAGLVVKFFFCRYGDKFQIANYCNRINVIFRI